MAFSGRSWLAALLCALPLIPSTSQIALSSPARSKPGASLRALASARGLAMGTAVNRKALNEDRRYGPAAARDFNMLTTEGEMRWSFTERARGTYDFSAGEQVLALAEASGMKVRGHNLVWSLLNPSWLETGSFTRDQLVGILRDHILAIVTHFQGRVAHWDVVNEPLDDNGALRDNVWLRGIGPGYIGMAFRWAHEADPNAKLFLNETGVEKPGQKLNALVKLVGGLRSQAVPVHGVGFQGHFGLSSPIDSSSGTKLRAAMGKFRNLGVETAITELT